MANRYETAAELVARLLRAGKTEAEILAEHSDDAIRAALRDARAAERNGVRGTRGAVDSAPVTRPFTLSPEVPRAPQATVTPRPRAQTTASERPTVFSTTAPEMPEVQGGVFGARRPTGERPAVPRADNDDSIDETALKAVAGDPPKLSDAVAAEREIGPAAARPASDANAPRMSSDQGGSTGGGPSGPGSGSGAGGPGGSGSGGGTPPGGGNPPPPAGPAPNTPVMTAEAIDRQNKWNIQGMVLQRLGAIEADFLKLRRGIPLSQEELLKLETNINVGNLFDAEAPRVANLEELIARVNIPEQKNVKLSGLDNFYKPELANKIHPDDFTRFVRREGPDVENTLALPAIPGISGRLSRASSTVKGQNLKPDEVGKLKEDLTDIGRINDNLDPNADAFKKIKTPAQLDQYLRESPSNAIPGSVYDRVVGQTSRDRETTAIGFGKFKSPELTRKQWQLAAAATFTAITAPVALDGLDADLGVSGGYYSSLPIRGLIEGAQVIGGITGAENKLTSGADYKVFLSQNNNEFRNKLLKLAEDYSTAGQGVSYQAFIDAHPEYVDAIPADIEAGLYIQKTLVTDAADARAAVVEAQAKVTTQEAAQSAADYAKAEAESALGAPMSSDSVSLSGSGSSAPPSASAAFKSAAEFNTAITQNNDALIGLTAAQVPKVSAAWAKVVADGDASPQERAGFEQELKTLGLQPSQVTLVAELGFSPP